MVNWINVINVIIYILSIICIVSLFFKYKNKFYLYQYLLKYFKDNKAIIIGNIKKLSLISLLILIIYGLCVNLPQYIVIFPLLFPAPNKLILEIIKVLFNEVIKLVNKVIKFIDIFMTFLIAVYGINVFYWFQKFNPPLSIFFIEFLFLICIIYGLKISILNTSKKKWILGIGFLIIFFIVIFSSNFNKDFETGIRITKGELKDIEGGSIELFSKNDRKKFDIVGENKELYIENDSPLKNYNITKTLFNKENNISLVTDIIRVTKGELKDVEGGSIELFSKNDRKKFDIVGENKELYIENDSPLKNYNITKTLFNKENNISLVTEINTKLMLFLPLLYNEIVEVKQGELLFVNNKNSKILDRYGNEINDKISIEGKIVVIENNPNNYIFIGNNLGWAYLNKNKKIVIEKDNFNINVLNLALFSFSIIYFWLKLYGKKSLEYYDKEIINKIRETPILLDRNKYDKFLTLSMFGLTIPNIWKIVTMKSIGEMNSSIWLQADLIVYVVLFSIILFCLITSKEISEYVKELEKENEKK